MKQLFLIALAAMLLAGCATTQHPPLKVSFLPERGDFISPDGSRLSFHGALDLAAGADYVILGEGHTNQCDHDMQQRMVRGLVHKGRNPAIGLEMIPVTLQSVLDRFMAGKIAAVDLGKELDWKTTWGYPYKLFSPLFALAEDHGLPVAGLNVPRGITKKASRQGLDALTDTERAGFPSRVIPHLPEQEAELRPIFEEHESLLGPEADLQRFLMVQNTWDTMMAEQGVALRKRTGRPVVLIAGSGHVDKGYGIPRRITLLDPGASVVTLVPLRDLRWFEKDLGSAAFYCPQSYESRMSMVLEVRQNHVVVVVVQPDGRAAKAGIRPGDILISAQGRKVQGLRDLHRAGKVAHDTNRPLVLGLMRYGERVSVNLGRLGKPKNAR